MIILAYAIVTFALIGLLSNFFFIFFEEANNELNKDYEKKRKLALEVGKKYINQFNKKSIATNIINIFKFHKK